MQGTRDHVLEFVIAHREARVEELVEALAITPAAVRRHLDNLRADGLIEAKPVRQATGRPYHAYSATERAAGALPAAYADLLERVLKSVDEREDVATAVAEHMAETIAERHRGEFAETSLPEVRIIQVTESLRADGILDGWHEEADGYHLVNGRCPYPKAAEVSKLPCQSDRKAIELLLGQDVSQINRIVDGAAMCEYLVRLSPEPANIQKG